MMIDTSPWSSCSRRSPWLPCSSHKISSTGPSVSPFRDFFLTILTVTQGVRQAGRHADRRELRRGDGGQRGFLQPSVPSGASSFAIPFRNF